MGSRVLRERAAMARDVLSSPFAAVFPCVFSGVAHVRRARPLPSQKRSRRLADQEHAQDMAHYSRQWRLQMKRKNGGGLLLAVFLLDFTGAAFAQTQATQDSPPAQPPAVVTAPSAVGVGATP